MMNSILQDFIGKFCLVYIDDILVYSSNVKEHNGHLFRLLTELETASLTLILKKCNLLQKSLTFLGHVVLEGGVRTEPD